MHVYCVYSIMSKSRERKKLQTFTEKSVVLIVFITFITHAQRKKMETEKGVIKVALRWMYGRVCEYVCVCFEW
jgi:hypothetical protein